MYFQDKKDKTRVQTLERALGKKLITPNYYREAKAMLTGQVNVNKKKEVKQMDVKKVMARIGEDATKKLSKDLKVRINQIEDEIHELARDTQSIFGNQAVSPSEIIDILSARDDAEFLRGATVDYVFTPAQKETLLYKVIQGEDVSLAPVTKLPHQETKLDQDICNKVFNDLDKLCGLQKYGEHAELFKEMRNALYDKRYNEKKG